MESLSVAQTIPLSDAISLTRDLTSLNAQYLAIAVSILLAVLAILGGAFYLFNFRPLKESVDKKEKEVDDRAKEEDKKNAEFKKELQETLLANKAEILDHVDTAIEEAKSNLSLDIKKDIAEFEVALIQKVTDEMDVKDGTQRELITSEVSDKLRKLEAEMKVNVETTKAKLDAAINQNTTKLSDLSSKLDDNKVDIMELQRFMYSQLHKAGAFYASIDLLSDAIAKYQKFKPYSWLVVNRLNELKKEIEGYVVEPDVVTKIETELIKIDADKIFAPLINEIRAIIAKPSGASSTSSGQSRADALQSTTQLPH